MGTRQVILIDSNWLNIMTQLSTSNNDNCYTLRLHGAEPATRNHEGRMSSHTCMHTPVICIHASTHAHTQTHTDTHTQKPDLVGKTSYVDHTTIIIFKLILILSTAKLHNIEMWE